MRGGGGLRAALGALGFCFHFRPTLGGYGLEGGYVQWGDSGVRRGEVCSASVASSEAPELLAEKEVLNEVAESVIGENVV